MTVISIHFTSDSLSSRQDKVTIADGTQATIADKCSIRLNGHLVLPFALHISSRLINLLSISSITKSLNCSVTFFPTPCVFQDLQTQQMIGGGCKVDGLYHFKPVELLLFNL